MRTTLLFILATLFIYNLGYGQKDSTRILLYKYGTSKEKQIKSERYLNVTMKGENEKYHGHLMGISDTSLFITYDYHEKIIQTDSSEIVRRYSRTDVEDASIIKLNINNVDYIDYETQAGLIFAGIGGVSLITSLIIAPLVSYRFKKGEFNSDRYLNIMKFSLPATIVGFTLHFSFGHRKFSVKPMN